MENLCEKYELNEAKLLNGIIKIDPNIKYFLYKIPFDDIAQTIRYEICNGAQNQQELWRNAHSALRQLLNDFGYGYTGKNRKEYELHYNDDGELEEVDQSNEDQLSEQDRKLIESIISMYEQQSVPVVCEKYGIEYNSTVTSAFNRYFPKNIGHGGKRVGSGNKKGWNENKEKKQWDSM